MIRDDSQSQTKSGPLERTAKNSKSSSHYPSLLSSPKAKPSSRISLHPKQATRSRTKTHYRYGDPTPITLHKTKIAPIKTFSKNAMPNHRQVHMLSTDAGCTQVQ
jgi:hypothetical protein